MNRPVVLCAFANPENDLPLLDEEAAEVQKVFADLANTLAIQYVHLTQVKVEDLYTHLTKCRRRIVLFHYAGHAEKGHLLRLKDGPNYAHGLAKVLGHQQTKLLVFLNGCSTFDQVKVLAEAGAPMIVATRSAISDSLAKTFSTHFYQLLLSGETLKEAFDQAQAVVKGLAGDQVKFRITRDLSADFEAPGQFPWMLYTKYESLLDYKLGDQLEEQAPLDDIQMVFRHKLDLIEALKEKVSNAWMEAAKCKDQIDKLKAINQGGAFDTAIKVLQDQVNKYSEEIRKYNKEQQDKDEELREEKKQVLLSENQQELQTALEKINYTAQFIKYQAKVDLSKNVGAFVLQGAPAGAPGFLIDRILNKASVKFTVKEIRKDFSALSIESVTEVNIWKTVAQYFGISDPVSPETLVKKIFEREALKREHLLFLFEHLNYPDLDTNVKIIRQFWFRFRALIQPFLTPENNPDNNKILLFLTDINCPASDSAGKTYDECFEETDLRTNHTYLMPVIEPLTFDELADWARELPDGLGLRQAVCQEIWEDHKGVILPTIEKICTKTETRDIIYDEYFARYEFKPPAP